MLGRPALGKAGKPLSGRLDVAKVLLGVLLAISIVSVCATNSQAAPRKAPTKVTVILGWYAEPARAGFYAAQKLGYYKAAGLDVTLLAGADVSPEQVVGSGRAAFGYDDGDAILQAAAQHIPIVAIGASYQKYGFIILFHAGQHIKSFADLGHRTAYIFPGSLYWTYIVKKYHLTGVTQASYSGSLGPFIENSSAINQGYLGVENVAAVSKGIHVGYLLVANSGYDPYSNVIFAMHSYITAHPAIVKAFVQATMKGWDSYKTGYAAIDIYMNQFNKGFSAPAMDKNAVLQVPLVYGGDAVSHGVGYMSTQRWTQTEADLLYLGVLKTHVNVASVFTDAFLRGG